MPFYQYEAEDQAGKSAGGVLDAANPAALRDGLSARGYRLTSVRVVPDLAPVTTQTQTTISNNRAIPAAPGAPAVVPAPPGYVNPTSATVNRRGPAGTPTGQSNHLLSLRAHAVLFRELAAAFRSGMTPHQAADMIGGRFKSGPLAVLLPWVRDQSQAGAGLADSLSNGPVALESSTIGIIRAGERGGFLPLVLDELAATYERQQEMQNRLSPIKLLYLGLVVPALLLAWPLPEMVAGSAAVSNSADTTVGGSLSAGFQGYLHGLLHFSLPAGVAIIAILLGWRFWTRTPSGRRISDRLALRVPVWGNMQRSLCTARFTRILGQLYKGGAPLAEAWELAVGSLPNTALMDRLGAQQPLVAANAPMSHALRASGVFGESEVSMVATGEHTGEVEGMLFRLAQYEEETLERSSRSFPMMMRVLFLAILAPLVILVAYHFFSGYMGAILKWSE